MYKELTLEKFIEETASKAAVPGGGSVAALTGALAAALSAMVGNLTAGKEKYASVETDMQTIISKMSKEKDTFLALIDEDSEAFDQVMQAMKLPKNTDEEKAIRTKTLQGTLIKAADAPYKIAEAAALLFDDIEFLVRHGNAHAQTDALVAAMLARTAILSALYNVKINLLSIKDKAYSDEMQLKVQRLEALAHRREKEILNQSDL